jgi:hypothetical protein
MYRRGAKYAGWDWCFTDNHWSNLDCMKSLVQNIIVPWHKKTVGRLERPANQKCIWLIDTWSVHKGKPFRDFMKENYPNILTLYVPPNCTGKLQPQDVSVQKPFKSAVTSAFRLWQDARYEDAMRTGADRTPYKSDVSVPDTRTICVASRHYVLASRLVDSM